ncbi:MAG: hypothetical protein WEF99_07760 [Thermoanaerobaculia bacterium]
MLPSAHVNLVPVAALSGMAFLGLVEPLNREEGASRRRPGVF